MNTDAFEMMNELTAKSYDAAKELGAINTRIGEKVLAGQMAAWDICVAAGNKQLELVSGAKDMRELFTAQTTLARETTESLIANAREMVEVATSARDEMGAWVEKGMEGAAANLNKVADIAKAA